tara:strand:+ start:38 stop:397 length:360 start_codon:yes stop_codon:yes gene_type:complete
MEISRGLGLVPLVLEAHDMAWTEERRKAHSRKLRAAWRKKRAKGKEKATVDLNVALSKLAKTSEYVRLMGGNEAAQAAIETYERIGGNMRTAHALMRRVARFSNSSELKEENNAGANGA